MTITTLEFFVYSVMFTVFHVEIWMPQNWYITFGEVRHCAMYPVTKRSLFAVEWLEGLRGVDVLWMHLYRKERE